MCTSGIGSQWSVLELCYLRLDVSQLVEAQTALGTGTSRAPSTCSRTTRRLSCGARGFCSGSMAATAPPEAPRSPAVKQGHAQPRLERVHG